MSEYILTAPCHFGVEAVLKREIQELGYEITKVEDGRVSFKGDELAICKSNIWLRTAERILLTVGEFEATTYDELFEKTKALPWERYIPRDGKFWVKKASTVNCKLYSSSDIQSLVKKAIVDRLGTKYNIQWFEETGVEYPLRVFAKKDKFYIDFDTSGNSLHKRGYRLLNSKAPISETLGAALIMLSPWNKDRILVDPFCGSGTLAIEAAMLATNTAPGLSRDFTAEAWNNIIPKKKWTLASEEASAMINMDVDLNIQGYDIDEYSLNVARESAKNAYMDKKIHFQKRDFKDLSSQKKYGVIVTNPPYGERLEDKKAVVDLYKKMGKVFTSLEDWSYFIITSFEEFETYFGKKSDKKRKLYNGMLKTNLYQYFGKKPPKNMSTF